MADIKVEFVEVEQSVALKVQSICRTPEGYLIGESRMQMHRGVDPREGVIVSGEGHLRVTRIFG